MNTNSCVTKVSDSPFGKTESLGLKGILCLCILIHHLYQFTGFFTKTYFGHFLNLLGTWAVAMFLFISGYGLIISYIANEQYISSFFQKRFLPLYLRYTFFVIIYSMFDFRNEPSFYKTVLTSLTWGNTLVSFGWFFPLIFALYLGFYFSFRYIHSLKGKCIVYFLFLITYMLFAYKLGQQYTPAILFFFGLLCGLKSDKLLHIVKKCPYVILVSCFIIFFSFYLTYVFSIIMAKFFINPIIYASFSVIANMAICLFIYTFSVLCHNMSVPIITNRAFLFLGRISLEIYCSQGLILRFLYPIIQNRLLYSLISICSIIFISIIINLLFILLQKKFHKKQSAS